MKVSVTVIRVPSQCIDLINKYLMEIGCHGTTGKGFKGLSIIHLMLKKRKKEKNPNSFIISNNTSFTGSTLISLLMIIGTFF